MTRLRVLSPVLALLIPAFSIVSAQDATPRRNAPSTPRPAHERLSVFAGSWVSVAPSAGGRSRDTCAWMTGGRRHMVCHRVTEGAERGAEQMMIYGYRGADSAYTVTVFLPGGQQWHYLGKPEGDRWIFNLVNARADQPRLRQVIRVSGDTLRFIEEVAENGGPWRLSDPSEDYAYVRDELAPSGNTSTQAADVSAAVQRYIDALQSRDTAYIRAASLPHATTVATAVPALPGQVPSVTTLDETIDALARRTRQFTGRVWSPRITVEDGVAVFIAPYDAWFDGQFSHCGIDHYILVRSGERWLVSHLAFTRQREGCQPSPLGPPA